MELATTIVPARKFLNRVLVVVIVLALSAKITAALSTTFNSNAFFATRWYQRLSLGSNPRKSYGKFSVQGLLRIRIRSTGRPPSLNNTLGDKTPRAISPDSERDKPTLSTTGTPFKHETPLARARRPLAFFLVWTAFSHPPSHSSLLSI